MHEYVDPTWDYILFTDSPSAIEQGSIGHWQVREIPFKELDNARNSRYPKINAHLALGEYRYSLYVDGNLNIKSSDLFERVEQKIAEGVLISIPSHPHRCCIYDEAEMVIASGVASAESVKSAIDFLRSEGYPEQRGLYENCIIFREHNDPKVKAAMELWWSTLRDYSRRDQLSFGYAAWRNDLTVSPLYTVEASHRRDAGLEFVESSTHARYGAGEGRRYPKFLISLLAIFIRDKKKRKLFRARYKAR